MITTGCSQLAVSKFMKTLLLALSSVALLSMAGCATAPHLADADTIQGTWAGREFRQGQVYKSWLNLTGREYELRAADGKEWYRGTFTLLETASPKQMTVSLTQSSVPKSAGQPIHAVYQLELGTEGHDRLVITANPPGNPKMPDGLGDRHARQIIYTRE